MQIKPLSIIFEEVYEENKKSLIPSMSHLKDSDISNQVQEYYDQVFQQQTLEISKLKAVIEQKNRQIEELSIFKENYERENYQNTQALKQEYDNKFQQLNQQSLNKQGNNYQQKIQELELQNNQMHQQINLLYQEIDSHNQKGENKLCQEIIDFQNQIEEYQKQLENQIQENVKIRSKLVQTEAQIYSYQKVIFNQNIQLRKLNQQQGQNKQQQDQNTVQLNQQIQSQSDQKQIQLLSPLKDIQYYTPQKQSQPEILNINKEQKEFRVIVFKHITDQKVHTRNCLHFNKLNIDAGYYEDEIPDGLIKCRDCLGSN